MESLLLGLGLSVLSAKVLNAIIIGVIILLVFVTIGGILTWVERRVSGFIQSRLGPNRVGPQGVLQWVADGVKLIFKEDLIPDGSDRILFRIAPYFCLIGVFCTLVVMPWGTGVIVADLNVGLFYFISITSLVVIGVLMAGWSSNNKWSLLGGMRAAAQIVSYEIPVGMGLLVPILIAGTLSMQGIVGAQGWLPWDWMLFKSPFTVISFIIFFIGSLAEANRIPFDLPEAESELVSGYCTEYSGFRYAVFFLSEWANLFVMGGLTTVVYLGGGNLPGIVADNAILSVVVFGIKTSVVVFVVMWIRWTLPRFRIDQLMKLSWKYLLPGAFLAFFGQAIYMLLTWEYQKVQYAVAVVVFVLFLGVLLKFIKRVAVNIKEQKLPVNSPNAPLA
ncbi:NADH-quinone oxidoreductase subunit NuoH [bacterium]|nr:NADH-quinone oxidoreductase subunit NuoH [bacterium]